MYHSFFSAFVNAKYSGGPCHLRLANTWKLPFRIADFIPTSLVESHPVSTLLFFINNQNFEISPKLLNRLTKVTSKYCLLIVSFSSLIFAHFIRIRYPSLLFVLYLIQTSWAPRHLNLTTFFISHDFSAKRCPANIRLGEDVLKMSWRRLEDVFSVTFFCLPRCLERQIGINKHKCKAGEQIGMIYSFAPNCRELVKLQIWEKGSLSYYRRIT